MNYSSTTTVKSLSHLHTTFDLLLTTSRLHDLFAPRTSWCVEPVSNEAFYYLNPDCPLHLSLPPSLPLYVYSHLHCTWQQSVVFAGEEKNKTALVKISLRQNSLSLKVPGEVEEWKVPRPSLSAGRLSKNKANHMVANPGVNEKESS